MESLTLTQNLPSLTDGFYSAIDPQTVLVGSKMVTYYMPAVRSKTTQETVAVVTCKMSKVLAQRYADQMTAEFNACTDRVKKHMARYNQDKLVRLQRMENERPC